jgi:ribosomal protein L34E
MYATRDESLVYHLLDAHTGRTICGLRVRPLRLKRKSALTHTPAKPLDKTVCKHCVAQAEPRNRLVEKILP